MGTIYVFTFPNGKQYVGQTVNVKARFSQHRNTKDRRMVVSDAIKKHGWDNVTRQEMTCPKEYLDWMESEWIRVLNCISPNGYNIETGGFRGSRHLSEQTRRKLSVAGKGRKFTEEHKERIRQASKGKHGGEKNGMFGKKHPEHSTHMTGDLNPMSGRNHSEDARNKISRAAKGRHHTDEAKRKMSESRKGKLFSDEHKRKIGEAQRGEKHWRKRKLAQASRRVTLRRI
jgi:group I intron endonuclease